MKSKDMNTKVAAVIIHGFTIVHVITAGVLGPAAGTVLTPMTAAMVVAIGAQCRARFHVAKALKIMTNYVGFLLGVTIAEFLVGLVPGLGNMANALATGFVTELLGWATFIVLRDNLDAKGRLNGWEMMKLLRAAFKLRTKNKEFTDKLKKARARMSSEEQRKYDGYMKVLTNRNSSGAGREKAFICAHELLKKYGVKL